MDSNFFNSRLKQLRKEHGLTQAQVSKALGIKLNTYSHMELEGKRVNMEMLQKLSRLFSVSVDSLLGEKKKTDRLDTIESSSSVFLFNDVTNFQSAAPNFMKDLKSVEQDMILAYRMLPENEKAKVKNYIEKTFKTALKDN